MSGRARLLGTSASVWLVAAGPAMAALEVAIVSPPAGEAVFGAVEIVAEVGEPVERLEFFVDGRRAGTAESPPYRLLVDVGQENREHRFEVVAHGADGGRARAERRTPAIRVDERVDLDLQQVYVTVTGPGGRRVLDLEERSFRIRDDGKPQKIVTFARGDIPMTATLLVDGSLSMIGKRLEAALAGVRTFLEDLRPLDEARLMVFGDRLFQVTPFAGPEAPPAPGLTADQAVGGTAIFDHLYLALSALEERQGRRVVVLLSDGVDLHSVLTPAELRDFARRSQAMVYWVRSEDEEPAETGPGPRRVRSRTGQMFVVRPGPFYRKAPLSSWRDAEMVAESLATLEQIVEESGGRVLEVASVDDVGPAFAEILAELREQYALGYYPDPSRNDGSWRKVRVELAGGRVEVRTRAGYVDR